MQPDLRQRRSLARFHRSALAERLRAECKSTTLTISCLSTLSASFNLLVINLVIVFLETKYETSSAVETSVAVASLVGCIIGQLLFGWLGDRLGLDQAMSLATFTTLISTCGSAQAALLFPLPVFQELSLWRFLVGIGVGGVYPLAAGLAQRAGGPDSKGRSSAISFSFFGVGMVLAPATVVVLLFFFDEKSAMVWRAALLAGSVPCAVLISLSRKVSKLDAQLQELGAVGENDKSNERAFAMVGHEGKENGDSGCQVSSPKSKFAIIGDDEMIDEKDDHNNCKVETKYGKESKDDSCENVTINFQNDDEDNNNVVTTDNIDFSLSNGNFNGKMLPNSSETFSSQIRQRYFQQKLFGTAFSWFTFDIMYYGNALFAPIVLEDIFGDSDQPNDTALQLFLMNLFVLPSFFISISTMDRLGPKYIQEQGFFVSAVLFLIFGIFMEIIRKSHVLLLIVYGGTFFFQNFGPNTTTYLLPARIFPKETSATFNGISAAAGKVGAVVGGAIFGPLLRSSGPAAVMVLCAGVSMVGWYVTHRFIEVPQQSIDNLVRTIELKKTPSKTNDNKVYENISAFDEDADSKADAEAVFAMYGDNVEDEDSSPFTPTTFHTVTSP
eukprot:g3433.t1